MAAGARDRLITLERDGGTIENDFGEPVENWAQIGREWARIIYGRGSERRAAAVEGSDQAAQFQVLSNPITRSLTTRDRIQAEGSVWDIVSVEPIRRGEIELTAVRRAS